MTYHMKRSERKITDDTEITAIMERCTYAVIACVKNNEPYAVTLSYAYDSQRNALYFHCAKEGRKTDFFRSNSTVCATIIDDDGYDARSCDHAYRSLILKGEIEFVETAHEKEHALQLLVEQLEKRDVERFMSKVTSGNAAYEKTQVLRLDIYYITGKCREKRRN